MTSSEIQNQIINLLTQVKNKKILKAIQTKLEQIASPIP